MFPDEVDRKEGIQRPRAGALAVSLPSAPETFPVFYLNKPRDENNGSRGETDAGGAQQGRNLRRPSGQTLPVEEAERDRVHVEKCPRKSVPFPFRSSYVSLFFADSLLPFRPLRGGILEGDNYAHKSDSEPGQRGDRQAGVALSAEEGEHPGRQEYPLQGTDEVFGGRGRRHFSLQPPVSFYFYSPAELSIVTFKHQRPGRTSRAGLVPERPQSSRFE